MAIITEPSNRTSATRRVTSSARRRLLRSSLPVYLAVTLATIVAWHLLSFVVHPLFLPSPARVLEAARSEIASGALINHVRVSYMRVLVGWIIGAVVAIPAGIIGGRLPIVRRLIEPYLNFFRFIPPIAFLSLALIWLGIGEASKISLIIYASLFIVFLNTVAGAQSVDEEKIRAARCLGASRRQVLATVVIPASVPYIITGLRSAMGICFMTVVAAELVAASEGVGYLIYNSRLFARTDLIFLGIITLGIMGFVADFIFRVLTGRVAYRYGIKY